MDKRWKFEKDGYIFFCRYDPKQDWVYVTAYNFVPGARDTRAGASGHEVIAKILAGEIIREDRKD